MQELNHGSSQQVQEFSEDDWTSGALSLGFSKGLGVWGLGFRV